MLLPTSIVTETMRPQNLRHSAGSRQKRRLDVPAVGEAEGTVGCVQDDFEDGRWQLHKTTTAGLARVVASKDVASLTSAENGSPKDLNKSVMLTATEATDGAPCP